MSSAILSYLETSIHGNKDLQARMYHGNRYRRRHEYNLARRYWSPVYIPEREPVVHNFPPFISTASGSFYPHAHHQSHNHANIVSPMSDVLTGARLPAAASVHSRATTVPAGALSIRAAASSAMHKSAQALSDTTPHHFGQINTRTWILNFRLKPHSSTLKPQHPSSTIINTSSRTITTILINTSTPGKQQT